MAQVYSVNAVGFINVDVPAGFSIIANQLDNMNGNKIGDLIKDVPDGTTIYKFAAGTGYSINAFDFGEWDPVPVPNVGEGFWVVKTAATTWSRSFSVND
jgi:hypothetical protein